MGIHILVRWHFHIETAPSIRERKQIFKCLNSGYPMCKRFWSSSDAHFFLYLVLVTYRRWIHVYLHTRSIKSHCQHKAWSACYLWKAILILYRVNNQWFLSQLSTIHSWVVAILHYIKLTDQLINSFRRSDFLSWSNTSIIMEWDLF